MFKKTVFILILCVTVAGFAMAGEEVKKGIPLYSVSSQDLDTSDSLNRISGDIDMGFNAPGQYNSLLSPSAMPSDKSDGY
jgi:hypothetical protein